MFNDNRISEQFKKCKKCGRELPIDKFASQKSKDGTKRYYYRVCKECFNAERRDVARQKKADKYLQEFLEDESMKLKRKYKVVRPERVLSFEESGITPIAEDEMFVRLLDYRDVWMSNYGRALTLYAGKYAVIQKKNLDGEIAYQLYKNVYDGKKWTYEKQLVKAWKLVVQEFVINYDIANNVCCWHKDNDMADLYYKNLYPLNEKQYAAVQEKFESDGVDTEEVILDIMNAVEYKFDGWKPGYMKRTVCGVGYRGGEVDYTSVANRKWLNMMQRCYCDNIHEYKPYYKPCTVCEEWHNFSNFKVWYDKNNIEGKQLDLDKDILIQGNTEYAPDTCALVGHYCNTIFEKGRGMKRSIVFNSKTGLYDVSISILNKKMDVGSFGTKEIAQREFLEYKKDYIRQYARKSKEQVQDKVYQAMMNWEVNIEETSGLSA